MATKKKPGPKLQAWIDARQRHRAPDAVRPIEERLRRDQAKREARRAAKRERQAEGS